MASNLSVRRAILVLMTIGLTAIVGCGDAFATDERSTADRVWEKRVERGLGTEPCDLTPYELDPGHYTGPLFDTHLHIPSIPDARPIEEELSSPFLDVANLENFNYAFPQLGVNITIAEIACTLEYERTGGAISFFPVFQQTLDPSLAVVNRSMEMYPDLFFPFINALGRDEGVPTVGNDDLIATLAIYPRLFAGYGEIALYRDASSQTAEPGDTPLDSELFDGIFETAKRENLTVYTHPGIDQFESFSRVLAANPDVNFIVHGDQIEVGITDLMAKHPNIYFTIDTLFDDQYLLHPGENVESFLRSISDTEILLERDLAKWKDLIEEFPNQFMWGTDRGGVAVWTFDPEVGRAMNRYARAFISKLDEDVQEKFAYRNALNAMNRGHISAGLVEPE